MLENHTERQTEKLWSGLWSGLSIEQMLMKSQTGPREVVGRGMTENVTRVWTKTIHRSAELIALDQAAQCIQEMIMIRKS